MKLLTIVGAIPPAKCGVADGTSILINNLANNNQKSDVMTDELYKGSKGLNTVHFVKKWKGFSFFKQTIKLVKTNKYDIVHIHYPSIGYKRNVAINFLPMYLRFFTKAKVVFTTHEYCDNSFLGKVRQFPSFLFSHKVMTVEEKNKKKITKFNILKRKRNVHVYTIGVNIPKSKLEDTSAIRKEITEDVNTKVMVHFGFIRENREFLKVLEAIKIIKDEKKLKSIFLIIADADESDQYQKKILDFIKENKLEENVFIIGYLKDESVANYIKASDFGITLFRGGNSSRHASYLAMRQEGLPVIATIPKKSFKTENTVSINNEIDEVVKSIIDMQESDNPRVYEKTNDWDEIAKIHIGIYNELIKKK